MPEVLGTGRGLVVRTERELCSGLTAAEQHESTFRLIEVMLEQNDRSPALQRLAGRIGENI